jgi:hypothetical protein
MVGIFEGEELKEKGMENLLNDIIAENFLGLENYMDIRVQEAYGTLNRDDQRRVSP